MRLALSKEKFTISRYQEFCSHRVLGGGVIAYPSAKNYRVEFCVLCHSLHWELNYSYGFI